jgi:hypothetical protein
MFQQTTASSPPPPSPLYSTLLPSVAPLLRPAIFTHAATLRYGRASSYQTYKYLRDARQHRLYAKAPAPFDVVSLPGTRFVLCRRPPRYFSPFYGWLLQSCNNNQPRESNIYNNKYINEVIAPFKGNIRLACPALPPENNNNNAIAFDSDSHEIMVDNGSS